MKKVRAYHWKYRPNFGDALAPYLLEKYCPDASFVWSSAAKAQVISVGSVLEVLPRRWSGYILGSGRMFEDSTLNLDEHATVLALRGPLTARAWAYDVAIGDPGLLADELVGSQSRVYDLGIVPHWSDKTLAGNQHYYGSWSTKVISTADNPLAVIRQIGRCKKIVSSSLHGLIVADAFGIPRTFEYTPRFEVEGGLFKFRDYSASIGAEFEVGELIQVKARRVDERKDELRDAYKLLNTLLGMRTKMRLREVISARLL